MMMFEEDDMMNGNGGAAPEAPTTPEAPAEGDMGGESTEPNTGM